jgi:hypothetical protein
VDDRLTIKSLIITIIAKAQRVLEQVSGDSGNGAGCQSNDRFRQQSLDVASGVLQFMKSVVVVASY